MTHDKSIGLGFILFFGALVLGATLLGACDVPAPQAKRILSGAGYSEIRLLGHAWFACGRGDTLSTAFSAKGPTGSPVEGAVCCGLFVKDCTIRTSSSP